MDKKKLLFVISSLNTGGAQSVLSNIVTNLPEDKWDIDILLNSSSNIVFPYRGNLIDLGLPEPANRNSLSYQLKVLIKRYQRLRKLKKTRRYAACVSFLESANFVNILTGNKYAKTIASVQNTLSILPSRTERLLAKAGKYYYLRADHVVACAESVRHDLIRNLEYSDTNIIAIPNCINVSDIQNRLRTAASQKPSRIFTFITSGRCEHQKGHWHLIRAFSSFAANHENSRLVILGEGSYTSYYQELIDAYGLGDRVILKGFVSEFVYETLASADVFVFPSLFEGLSLVLLEALSCGLPVISSDYKSSAREVLAPDTDIDFAQTFEIELAKYGVLTPVCSGTKYSATAPLEEPELLLLSAMELLFADDELRASYATASKERSRHYSVENCIAQWQNLLSDDG
ncbi:MAG: glycosyltransferase [Oscillospiraceae bacterium]|nr:glycosyltransferase [Oscillospiraceae bacterium]